MLSWSFWASDGWLELEVFGGADEVSGAVRVAARCDDLSAAVRAHDAWLAEQARIEWERTADIESPPDMHDLFEIVARGGAVDRRRLERRVLSQLNARAPPRFAPACNEPTLLTQACNYGRADVARLLVELGASVDKPDGWGNTPLQWAMNRGHQDIAEFLLVDCNARPA